MKNFLLISDVYCPWCYAFTTPLKSFLQAHPDWSITVWCGNLIEAPTTMAAVLEEYPNMLAFYEQLTQKTGAVIGDVHLRQIIESPEKFPMDSISANHAFVAIRELLGGHSLEVLEAFYTALYHDGKNLLDVEVQCQLAYLLGIPEDVFTQKINDPAIQDTVVEECRKSEMLMGDLVLYPTLYAQTEKGACHFIARGYVSSHELENAFQQYSF